MICFSSQAVKLFVVFLSLIKYSINMSTPVKTVRNGVDVDALVATVQAIAETHGVGEFQFKSKTDWKSGAKVETKFPGCVANGEDIVRDKPHVWSGDEPTGLLDRGLNAVAAPPISCFPYHHHHHHHHHLLFVTTILSNMLNPFVLFVC